MCPPADAATSARRAPVETVKDLRTWTSFALASPAPPRQRLGCTPGCIGCRCVSRWLVVLALLFSALATLFVATAPPPLDPLELQRR